ncbi:MAG: EutN/CcmL family microcompartment protein [Mahellales bacterium]
MIVGKIIGNIVCTQKDSNLVGKKMLLVQPLKVTTLEPQGSPVVALDAVGAGEGEVVMVVGGSSARLADNYSKVPVDQAIVGILDTIDIGGKVIYRKEKQ